MTDKERIAELEAELEAKDAFESAKVCREIARDMIMRNPEKAAWIFWDGNMRLISENEVELETLAIEDDKLNTQLMKDIADLTESNKQYKDLHAGLSAAYKSRGNELTRSHMECMELRRELSNKTTP